MSLRTGLATVVSPVSRHNTPTVQGGRRLLAIDPAVKNLGLCDVTVFDNSVDVPASVPIERIFYHAHPTIPSQQMAIILHAAYRFPVSAETHVYAATPLLVEWLWTTFGGWLTPGFYDEVLIEMQLVKSFKNTHFGTVIASFFQSPRFMPKNRDGPRLLDPNRRAKYVDAGIVHTHLFGDGAASDSAEADSDDEEEEEEEEAEETGPEIEEIPDTQVIEMEDPEKKKAAAKSNKSRERAETKKKSIVYCLEAVIKPGIPAALPRPGASAWFQTISCDRKCDDMAECILMIILYLDQGSKSVDAKQLAGEALALANQKRIASSVDKSYANTETRISRMVATARGEYRRRTKQAASTEDEDEKKTDEKKGDEKKAGTVRASSGDEPAAKRARPADDKSEKKREKA